MAEKFSAQAVPTDPDWHLPRRLVYVVSHAYPWSSNGYAVRTHEIAHALHGAGIEVIVVTRPGRPWDMDLFDPARPVQVDHRIEGVRYLSLPLAPVPNEGRRARLRRAERALAATFEVLRPVAVMAASNWETAQPAQFAARRLGLPFLYEQRGFWEMARAARDPGFAGSPEHALHVEQETAVARGARAVFTLNGAMRDELVRRGVPAETIQIVGNGFRRDLPVVARLDRRDLGITARHLAAYLGSLSPHEGVEDLLRAVARLRAEGVDAAALIVGSGQPQGIVGATARDPAAEALRALAGQLGIAAHVHLVPQIPSARIGAYYAISDVVVMPRRRDAMTAMVPPLKPYAAAAWGVPVVMTDMPPLDEIARDIDALLFAEGDVPALAAVLRRCFETGRRAIMAPPDPSARWSARVRPILRIVLALDAAARDRQAPVPADVPAGAPGAGPAAVAARFDRAAIPQAVLGTGERVVAGIGPCAGLADAAGVRFTALTRASLLPRLATGETGIFLVDWAGLQDRPDPEWDGLWSIGDMRLNRQIMDAARIALDRGWICQVRGPVVRSAAPLFRTVAAVFAELPASGGPA